MKKSIFLILTLMTLLMTSCSNIIESSVKESNISEPESTEYGYVNITGNIVLDGAYPASSDRTAFPVNPSLTDLDIFTYAYNVADENDYVIGSSGSGITSYTIPIPVSSPNKTYKIKVYAKKGSADYLYGESSDFTISTSVRAVVKNIELRSIQNSGQGSLKLVVGAPVATGINSARLIYYAGDDRSNTPQFITADKNQLEYTFEKGSISGNTVSNGIDSGSYLMDFEFYSETKCNGNLLYSFSQRVNIFNLQETNTWVKNGGEPYLEVSDNTSTQCLITATLINEFKLTEIFVDSTAAGYTNESGTFLNPCLSLSAAITKLQDKNKDYKIYIKGSLSGRQEIPDTLTDTSDGTYHAKSLTLIGYNGLNDSGIPQDSLDGGFTLPTSDGVTLKINSSVPVIIKNLMITGGNNGGDGGGIYSTGKLTLDSGALVCSNTAACGGGIMNNGGELTINSGAVIAENTAYNTASDTNFIYGGGGVYNYNGKLVMSGGQIKANTTNQCGGGIYNHMNDKDKITEVYIYGDAVIGGDTDADGNKANVEVDGYGGGGIYNRGGLVYFGCTAYSAAGEADTYDYYEPDASKLVEWTGKISHNTSGAWGGGYLNSFSSASSSGWSSAEQIKATGITHLMSGQISANTAVKGGGIYNGSMLILGGTINNNSATSRGGGIYNGNRLQLRENAYIPAGSSGANDVFFEVADNPNADNAPYIMLIEALSPPSDSGGIVATITPSLYENGKTILTYSTSATTTLQAEYGKFAITPENVGGGAVKKWVLRSDGILIEPSVSNLTSAPSSGTYSLSTADEMQKIRDWISDNQLSENATFVLSNDIELSDWGINSTSDQSVFRGTFDGNGHTITISSFAPEGESYTLLGKETDSTTISTIKNLTVAGDISGPYQGIVVRFHGYSTMENVVNKVNVTYVGESSCAGLFGDCGNGCYIINCRNEGNINAPNATLVGGFFSYTSSLGVNMTGCVNTGNITGKEQVGGICGRAFSTINNCRNEGIITGEDIVGGIAGRTSNTNYNSYGITNCINTGEVNVTKTEGAGGGICGVLGDPDDSSNNYANLRNCINLGSVIRADGVATNYIGAIAGKYIEGVGLDRFENNYYAIWAVGGQDDSSGVCYKITKSGTTYLAYSELTVGSYTGKDLVSLLNEYIDANSLTSSCKQWEYDSSGNLVFKN